ncbi:MAG TPA: sulfite exporter TauE/SafE family protein [Chromatiales bacterium]|nr:sulfite exporter TauE/SafE family protein [Thiotrichales bacterium]HIP67021.1 sulfite exporter TauE/SafE family protein [Chromatiales bacterium]
MSELSNVQYFLVGLIFIWTGFVRTGLGFGGAALGLPLMLLVLPEPLLFLPIIGTHLLFFSSITVFNRLDNVDWSYLWKALVIMILPMIIGILGLLNLPGDLLSKIVFIVTLFYGFTYIFNYTINSKNKLVDTLLLVFGGYVSGTSLIGAPLIVAVFMQHVAQSRLRDTLFVLWFILVCIKMSAFILADVDLQLRYAIYLLPIAAIGHFIGLHAHDMMLKSGGVQFKRVIGVAMVMVTLVGFWQLN